MRHTLFILFTFFSILVLAQESSDLANIKLDKTDFDFGEILQGQKKVMLLLLKIRGRLL